MKRIKTTTGFQARVHWLLWLIPLALWSLLQSAQRVPGVQTFQDSCRRYGLHPSDLYYTDTDPIAPPAGYKDVSGERNWGVLNGLRDCSD